MCGGGNIVSPKLWYQSLLGLNLKLCLVEMVLREKNKELMGILLHCVFSPPQLLWLVKHLNMPLLYPA